MTVELKTIKDMGYDVKNQVIAEGDFKPSHSLRMIPTHKLKEEAIKWIKKDYVPIASSKTGKMSDVIEITDDGNFWVKEWIKHFFNIKEEELE